MLAVDGHRGDRFGQPCCEGRPACGGEALLAEVTDSAADDSVDVRPLDARVLDHRADGVRVQVDRMHPASAPPAFPLPTGPYRVDDDSVPHGLLWRKRPYSSTRC
jgi:hypothetical protein